MLNQTLPFSNRAAWSVATSIAIIFFAASGSQSEGADDLSTRLAQFDAAVLPLKERELAARMVEQNVEQRLKDANERSSATWEIITTRAAWETFRQAKLATLRDSLGEPPPETPLRHRVTGGLSGDGYRIENVVFQNRRGLWITANLYKPDKPRASMPGILISHAHHTSKEHGELQDMGVTWARAGCLVLVIDHLGHGERRQHPFRSAADYARSFQTGRQDYFFRYDVGIQLHLAGESLIGWLAWDLMRGVDLLLAQEGIDPKRIILLGAVAGGGDPAAVAAALDDRIAAAAPFNFGGPQPETRYPLPENAETWFHYAGAGSWESTRNLRRSAADGFLPWVIVGSIAPRRLIYAHEFSWDRERDPVWKRLRTIYDFYQNADHLAFTHGRGELRGQPPEATHCTHIGPPHRQMIHAAFKEWFGIDVASESSDRHPAETLRALTPETELELRPKKLAEVLSELADQRIAQARTRRSDLTIAERRRQVQMDWSRALGKIEPPTEVKSRSLGAERIAEKISADRIALSVEPSIVVPTLILKPINTPAENRAAKSPVAVVVSQAGKQQILRERAGEIAALLVKGWAVCLPEVRGTGESGLGADRGRRSAATALSSSELMLGGTMIGSQLRDLRAVLAWLRTRDDLDGRQIHLWGDSFIEPNPPATDFQIPRDSDAALPRSPEPLGGLLVLLAALFEEDVQSVYVHGGLASFGSVLSKHLALIPHDAIIPGVLTTGDLCDLVGALVPRPVRLERMVDGWNRRLSGAELENACQVAVLSYRGESAGTRFSFSQEYTSAVQWLADGGSDRRNR